jgi:plastocyanin
VSVGRAVAVAALLLAAASPVRAAQLSTVAIVDAPRAQARWGYAPTSRRVAAGTWVTWSNGGQDAHTVTALDGSFDSGELQPSEGFSWYFADPGTYRYLCALHPWMTGQVIVGNGQTTAPPAEPAVPATPPDEPSDDGMGSAHDPGST